MVGMRSHFSDTKSRNFHKLKGRAHETNQTEIAVCQHRKESFGESSDLIESCESKENNKDSQSLSKRNLRNRHRRDPSEEDKNTQKFEISQKYQDKLNSDNFINYPFLEEVDEKVYNAPKFRQIEKLHSRKIFLSYQACFIEKITSNLTGVTEKRSLIHLPIPKCCGNMQLSIIRNRSGLNRFHPKYVLVITIQQGNGNSMEREILVGKKRSGNKTSNYRISFDTKSAKEKGNKYIGKVRAVDS
ncbi:unnamed protein product [Moneuplotes crassus]|uniref:Tubby C-terminal domain-containing protein n=1 Tax=Euplotes crassus TaxID=5936 RepID=A0AAD2D980_EUPCR|nr:unnamed protein product [Moneuplotes crassus]